MAEVYAVAGDAHGFWVILQSLGLGVKKVWILDSDQPKTSLELFFILFSKLFETSSRATLEDSIKGIKNDPMCTE